MTYELKSSFAKQLEDFINFKVSLGFSPNSYVSRAKSFDSFCFTRYPTITELTEEMVFNWIYHENSNGNVNPEKVRFARLFGSYLNGLGNRAYVLPHEFTPKKAQHQIPYLFSQTEISDLFREIDRLDVPHSEFSSTMLSVYFRLVYTCGLRPGEARKLKIGNINIATGEILITQTKNNMDRVVVMSEAMRELCERYSSVRNVLFSDSDYFFPNTDGGCCSDAWFQRYFRNAFAKSHSSVPMHQLPFVRVYNLRHQFASDVIHKWINDGENLENRLPYLQAYMGHTDVSQTAYYVHILPDKLKCNAGIDWLHMNAIIPEVEDNE